MQTAKFLGTTLTAIGLASAITACASTGSSPKLGSGSPFQVTSSNIALATRAQMALASNDLGNAVNLAEQAVERSPNDAGFRALLGNAYLASGRYASAENAFRDSLRLYGSQPQVVLKLALVEIGMGRKDEAIALLQSAGDLVDASDRGLALALGGEPALAVELLDAAARQPGADARLRQNLALAHALNGDWQNARVIASQDLAPDALEQRMTEWLSFASPDARANKVATFIGIPMSPADPGQPTRLALGGAPSTTRMAAAAPVAPAPVAAAPTAPEAPVELAYAEPAPQPMQAPELVASAAAPAAAPVEFAAIEPLAPPPPPRVIERTAPSSVTVALPAARPVKMAEAAPKPVKKVVAKAPRPALSVAAAPVNPTFVRRASAGNSRTVVQLGAYSTRERVEAAWSRAVSRHASLRSLTPMTARFDAPQGSVYRLSVKGFGSDRDALRLCQSLKGAGSSCFVRRAAGDAPVSFASR